MKDIIEGKITKLKIHKEDTINKLNNYEVGKYPLTKPLLTASLSLILAKIEALEDLLDYVEN